MIILGNEQEMKIFLISPVKLATPENTKLVKQYVEEQEKLGHQVYWPIRNTDQNDSVGIEICDANLRAILEADEIHIWYLKESRGIHFDMGAAYMLIRILGYKKKVIFVNKGEFEKEIKVIQKSFPRLLSFWEKEPEQQR